MCHAPTVLLTNQLLAATNLGVGRLVSLLTGVKLRKTCLLRDEQNHQSAGHLLTSSIDINSHAYRIVLPLHATGKSKTIAGAGVKIMFSSL